MRIEGILFDSGDTLVFPKGGSWWPGPNFESVLGKHGLSASGISPDKMRSALDEGEKYLEVNHLVVDCEEEKEQFRDYYRVICRNLGFATATDELIEDLASAYVDECNFELYPDTVDALERLAKQGMILGILSDAWPSLEKKYVALGIRHYFKSFTISAEVGCCKPDDRIYRRAADEIGIDAGSLLFVDDDCENVRAAVRSGMNGVVILRNREAGVVGELTCVRNLGDIFEIIS